MTASVRTVMAATLEILVRSKKEKSFGTGEETTRKGRRLTGE